MVAFVFVKQVTLSAKVVGSEQKTDWEPTFLVLLGYPDKSAELSPREAIDIDRFLVRR